MFDQPAHIDLALPRSWNQCTTDELETIAACIMKHSAMADRYHPYDWQEVKAELFFLLTGVEIISTETKAAGTDNPDSPGNPDDTAYLCRLVKKKERRSVLRRPWFRHEQKAPEFRLRTWQVQSWIDTQLSWLDDEKQTLLLFPYKQLVYTRRWQWRWPFRKKVWLAPSELLQDFTWRQYRHLQDYMELFIRQQNHLVKFARFKSNSRQVEETRQQMTATRNEFLKVLFGGGRVERINDIQWQVILLWWSGMMHYLKDHYPRCFKSAGKSKKQQRQPNPLELYTSIIATMQKYIGIDEEKVNSQTFHIILEQLERIARENEEIEKMNRKHKSR